VRGNAGALLFVRRALDGVGRPGRGAAGAAGKRWAFGPGARRDEPSPRLGPARVGAAAWLDKVYQIMRFAPAELTLRPGEGPPHIRLDRAAQFLIGDKL